MEKQKANAMINRLITSYRFKKLPDELSNNVREWFKNDISNNIDLDNIDSYSIYTNNGALLSSSIDRIIIGDYGPYIEFDSMYLNENILYEDPKEAYRSSNKYIDTVKYLVFTTNGENKIYLQLKTVSYADFLIGKLYVSPYDVVLRKNNSNIDVI